MQLFWNPKSLEDNYRKNAIRLQQLRLNMKKFNCINDDLSHKDNEGLVENKVFPRKFHCVICLENLLIQRTVMSTVISVRSFMYGHFQKRDKTFNQIRFVGNISFCSTVLWRLLPKQKSIWNINFIPLQLFYSVPNCVSGLSERWYHKRTVGRWQNRVAWRHISWRTTLAALHMFLCRTREVQ